MTIQNMFNMAKGQTLTQDGCETDVEDKRYNIGDISQKTGLQKTANGWVKPRNGKAPGAKTGPGESPKMGSKEYNKQYGLSKKDVSTGAQVDKIYERQLKRIKELRAKGFTDEQIDNDKIIKQTKEDMKNVGKKPESKPAGETSRMDAWLNEDPSKMSDQELMSRNETLHSLGNSAKGDDFKKVMNAGIKIEEELSKRKLPTNPDGIGYEEEKKKAGSKSAESKPDAAEQHDKIGEEIKGNLGAAKYYFDKAQSFSPTDPSYKTYMTKAKQYNDKAKSQADDNGFDFEEMHNSGITQAVNKYAEKQSKPAEKKPAAKSSPKIEYQQSKANKNTSFADVEGNRILITKTWDGKSLVQIRKANSHSDVKNYFSEYAPNEVAAKKMAEKEIERINKKYPAKIEGQGISWERTPGTATYESFTGYDNGNDIRVYQNPMTGEWQYNVREEHHGDAFKNGSAKSRDEAMKEAKQASDSHKHSGVRPTIIPSSAATSMTHKRWDNNQFYHSNPKDCAPRVLTKDTKIRVRKA